MSSPAQTRRIHALARDARLKDHQYRAVLAEVGRVETSKDLDEAGADRVIAALGRLAGRAPGGARSPAVTATGRFAPKLQSLWISGWNLGVIRDRSDRAMLAYVAEQTGVAHTRFLNDATIAAGAVEGLKAWLARDGGVRWPSSQEPRRHAMAVVEAIGARLLALGDTEVGLRPYLHGARSGLPTLPVDYTTGQLHALCNLLGARLRARRAARDAAPAPAPARRPRKRSAA